MVCMVHATGRCTRTGSRFACPFGVEEVRVDHAGQQVNGLFVLVVLLVPVPVEFSVCLCQRLDRRLVVLVLLRPEVLAFLVVFL